jgi:hypothetical protein
MAGLEVCERLEEFPGSAVGEFDDFGEEWEGESFDVLHYGSYSFLFFSVYSLIF